MVFQSTPPIRVATECYLCGSTQNLISIHATHTGGDFHRSSAGRLYIYFNPRHPYGWRPWQRLKDTFLLAFQSTPPIRVATFIDRVSIFKRPDFNPRHPYGWRRHTDRHPVEGVPISIHATHTGGDTVCHAHRTSIKYFNPRHPYGWRRFAYRQIFRPTNFNPRHPYGWRLQSF